MTRLRDLMRREPARGLELPRWLDRLLSVGIVTTDPEVVRRQRCVNVACHFGALSSASYLVMTSVYDHRGLWPLNVYNLLMVIVGLILPHAHRFGTNFVAVVLVVFISIGQMYVVWMLGITSDLHIFYTLAGAMLFFFGVQNWKLFLGLFLYAAALLLLALNYAPVDGLLLPTDGRLRDLVSSHTMMSVMAINAAIIFYALTVLRKAEVELEQQYERSEALVTTVMPAPIAARLKSGAEERVADRIENLSMLFGDLVGFTTAAHDLPPEEIVGFLDGLVRAFDALAAEHGVDKIKTVGDCYMAVGGLDGRTTEGAAALGRFALAMLAAARSHRLGAAQLPLRIGIHCGPVTAGVIGDTRFSYDVWGDAVNVASRMESHGQAGRIQVSEAFRVVTRDAFMFEEGGVIDIKGIGAARTHFLVGVR